MIPLKPKLTRELLKEAGRWGGKRKLSWLPFLLNTAGQIFTPTAQPSPYSTKENKRGEVHSHLLELKYFCFQTFQFLFTLLGLSKDLVSGRTCLFQLPLVVLHLSLRLEKSHSHAALGSHEIYQEL